MGQLGLFSNDEIQYLSVCAPKRGIEFVCSRGALRLLLSRYEPSIHPREWEFKKNGFGKPELTTPLPKGSSLAFNISHTQDTALIAITRSGDIGVDIEDPSRPLNRATEIAQGLFSPAETAEIEASPESERNQLFFKYWTLKEAVSKALGKGLSLPFDQFQFSIVPGNGDRNNSVSLRDTAASKTSGYWSIQLFEPLANRQAAVAVLSQTTQPIHFTFLGELEV